MNWLVNDVTNVFLEEFNKAFGENRKQLNIEDVNKNELNKFFFFDKFLRHEISSVYNEEGSKFAFKVIEAEWIVDMMLTESKTG